MPGPVVSTNNLANNLPILPKPYKTISLDDSGLLDSTSITLLSSLFRYSSIFSKGLSLNSLKNGHLSVSSPISISQSARFRVTNLWRIGNVSSSLSSLLSTWRANLWAFKISLDELFTND